MNTKILLSSLVLGVVLLGGCNAGPSPHEPEQPAQRLTKNQASQETKATISVLGEDGEAMDDTAADDEMMEMTDSTAPQYVAYSASTRAELHGNKPYVLFFHAPWCPICRALDASINGDLTNFPDGTVILKTDYDTETALKEEYDIKIQSTLVVLDANGEVVWQGQDPTIEDLKGFIEESRG